MAGKPLNKTNLMALGAEALADLLLETVKGDAARQRRVRMALAADDGPEAVAADIRKRFAAIRRAQSFLNRPAQKKLAQELTGVIELITTRIAPTAPSLAFDLLWAQLHLAEGIHARTDDSWGSIGDTMRAAMEAIGEIAPQLTLSAETLAEQILEATVADGYGAFDHAIDVLAPALGPDGLAALKGKATAAFDAPISAADLAQHDYVRHSERESRARAHRNNTLERILQDVAAADCMRSPSPAQPRLRRKAWSKSRRSIASKKICAACLPTNGSLLGKSAQNPSSTYARFGLPKAVPASQPNHQPEKP